MMKKYITFIISYLKDRQFLFLLFCSFAGIFLIVFSLYHIPLEPVLYAFTLCLYIGLSISVFDFIKFYKRHQLLTELHNKITVSIEELPPPRGQIEDDYQTLIALLHQDKVQTISKADEVRTDMIDYFTLWAHQIKTPIAAMNLLLQTEENEQNAELSIQLFKVEQYVDMVLQYLRLDHMSSDLVLKRYSLDDIVKQAIRKYAKMFIRKRIKLQYTTLHVDVLTDEKWLVFVIEQILSNAIKYSHQGTISIYMDPSKEKTLVIEDTGIGIAREDLPRVTEKGYTGYNGRADKKSTGIGLYLCKQILSKLSHTFDLESQVGNGTKVLIHLPTKDMQVE
ncbi:sensor histidine kinase [Niallia sp. XMNu-256]|uniref:sensor histidine kinase n=1 Tax=Niallia sp. XMNu-256 TaxID=3082444 RepID=UPI0030CD0113